MTRPSCERFGHEYQFGACIWCNEPEHGDATGHGTRVVGRPE